MEPATSKNMDTSLKLFIVGFIVGLIIALVPVPGEVVGVDEPEKIIKQIFSGGATIWKVIYFSILLLMMPILAIEPLKKRFTMKQLIPFPFIIGNSTSMVLVTLIFTVATLFN